MQTINLICFRCIHWTIKGCIAFPDGIPDVILETNRHDKPIPEQNNKLVFEEKKNKETD